MEVLSVGTCVEVEFPLRHTLRISAEEGVQRRQPGVGGKQKCGGGAGRRENTTTTSARVQGEGAAPDELSSSRDGAPES